MKNINNEVTRVLDANYNRFTEGLRILEDHFRYGCDCSLISSQIKELRHNVRSIFEQNDLFREKLVQSRNIVGDVGTEINADDEHVRTDLPSILKANFKRAEESIRVIEEYGKLISSEFGQSCEKIRYKLYELEIQGLLELPKKEKLKNSQLCLLASSHMVDGDLLERITLAIEGGVDMVQLREKKIDDNEFLQLAKKVKKICDDRDAIFIINDRVDIALAVEADGVHVGQEDLPAIEVRKLIGRGGIVGISTHSESELTKALTDGADYVGMGPVFSTKTTDKVGPGQGENLLTTLLPKATVPVLCIGGINSDNVSQVIEWGGSRVAVSSGILNADDPKQAAATIKQALLK